jgi:hypothetical protein
MSSDEASLNELRSNHIMELHAHRFHLNIPDWNLSMFVFQIEISMPFYFECQIMLAAVYNPNIQTTNTVE